MALIRAQNKHPRSRDHALMRKRGVREPEKGDAYVFSCEEHGGNIYKIAEELGLPKDKIIDFSASINPLGISEKVKEVIKKEMDSLVNYPDPDTKRVRKKIAQHYGIESEAILCGNGSTELIYLIPRTLQPKKVLITAPTFSGYERAIMKAKDRERRAQTEELMLHKQSSFRIDVKKFICALQGCDMAFLCNPNNPTGQLLSRKEVLEIARAASEAKCYLVVDEAFIDFCPEASVIHDVRENPYLMVLRSMTKFYALTGLRIGYGVFHGNVIDRIKEYKEPWTVNSLAQKAAIAALEDSAYERETLNLINSEKEFLEKNFREMGIEFLPSAANYYLLKIVNAIRLVLKLRQKGILIRDCSNFRGLDDSYIRIAVRSHNHNRIILEELAESCEA